MGSPGKEPSNLAEILSSGQGENPAGGAGGPACEYGVSSRRLLWNAPLMRMAVQSQSLCCDHGRAGPSDPQPCLGCAPAVPI